MYYNMCCSYIVRRRVCLLLFLPLLWSLSCQQSAEKDDTVLVALENYAVEHAHYFRFVTDDYGKTLLEVLHPDTDEIVSFYPIKGNKNCVALSSTFIGMLSELGLDSLIVGVSEMQYVFNELVRKNYSQKKVVEAGYDTQLNVEAIVAKRPSVLFHSGFTSKIAHQQQLESVGVECIPIYDWKEQTPLGRAEWIKVYGFLFGNYSFSDSLFSEIEKRYVNIKNDVEHLSSSKLVLCGNVMGGEWYCPAGESFFAELLRDANISYKYSDTEGTGSIALTQEQVLKDNRQATYWINAGATSLNELKTMNSKAVFFESFTQKNVYCYSKNSNFYWEKVAICPDKLLSDLATITHPDFSKDKKLFFYERLL